MSSDVHCHKEKEREGWGGQELGSQAETWSTVDQRVGPGILEDLFISRVCRRVVSVLHSEGTRLESTCPTWHCCFAHKFGPVPSAEGWGSHASMLHYHLPLQAHTQGRGGLKPPFCHQILWPPIHILFPNGGCTTRNIWRLFYKRWLGVPVVKRESVFELRCLHIRHVCTGSWSSNKMMHVAWTCIKWTLYAIKMKVFG